mgnify:CR=1 FL=1
MWNATNSAFDFSHAITVPSTLTLTSNAPRIFLYEADTTDLNTALFSSGGKFTIRTTTDDDATRTTRLEVDHSTGDIGFYENNGLMVLSPMALIVVGIIIWVQRSRNRKLIEN